MEVEATKHLQEMHGGPGGGSYNDFADQFIKDFAEKSGTTLDPYAAVTVEQLLQIREALLDLYDIINPGCKRLTPPCGA